MLKPFIHSNFGSAIDVISFCLKILFRKCFVSDLLNVAQVFYVLSLITFFIRFTRVFSMHNNLGPKIVMISKMIKDLSFFMYIALGMLTLVIIQLIYKASVSFPVLRDKLLVKKFWSEQTKLHVLQTFFDFEI